MYEMVKDDTGVGRLGCAKNVISARHHDLLNIDNSITIHGVSRKCFPTQREEADPDEKSKNNLSQQMKTKALSNVPAAIKKAGISL